MSRQKMGTIQALTPAEADGLEESPARPKVLNI